jgi:hypothetical protein
MPSVIHVERDSEGLQQALRALFEESFQRAEMAKANRRMDAETRQRMLDEMADRQLASGYYTRATYLLDLGSALETGVTYSAGDLTRTDILGLQAMARARREFESDHPACTGCGARQDNAFATHCKGCRVKFLRGEG